MDKESQEKLAQMIHSQRIASLGTLKEGAPLVSMILYIVAPDFSRFYIHASKLAQHTQGFLKDPRVCLMIAETDADAPDPQLLRRVSISGEIVAVPRDSTEYAETKDAYLRRFPKSAQMFELADFGFYRIEPKSARYVAGFGKAFNLGLEDFKRASAVAA
jgi:putative heme iron utilization protein